MGKAYAFCRDNPPPLVGHVGWGFEKDGSLIVGATERPMSWPNIWQAVRDLGLAFTEFPGEDNGAWMKTVSSLEEALPIFCSLGYKWWKAYDVAHPNPQSALSVAEKTKDTGWWLIFNNCLDHTGAVLEAYGVPWQQVGGQPPDGMPWKQTNPAPIGWFHAWNVREHGI